MTPYYERGGLTIFHPDGLEVLPTFETESVGPRRHRPALPQSHDG
jgi:hypothetical protein